MHINKMSGFVGSWWLLVASHLLGQDVTQVASQPNRNMPETQLTFAFTDQSADDDSAGKKEIAPIYLASQLSLESANSQSSPPPSAFPLLSQVEADRAPVVNEVPLEPQPATSSRNRRQDGMLDAGAMLRPLANAAELFGRLDLQDDMRDYADTIATGPRIDSSAFTWVPAAYTWVSPAFYHHALYFEQPNLERYGIGRSRLVQPLLSSAHFFGSIPLVPYKTLTHHPRERVYSLGHGRPGNCQPLQRRVVLGQSTVGEVFMFWQECSGY